MLSSFLNEPPYRADLELLVDLLRDRVLTPQISWRGSFEEVSGALAALRARRVGGKARPRSMIGAGAMTNDVEGDAEMFEGFSAAQVEANGTTLHVVQGGSRPPVLLLYGYPQTHAMWHRIAPALAERHTVICSDLRGYGDSAKPASDATHAAYSKRAMAQDQFELMRALGFERFAVVGHDRGGRVARRLALDHADSVARLALLDIVPTATIYASLDQGRATTVWRYFFLIQPPDLPERLIGANPDFYFWWTIDEWCGQPDTLAKDALAEYRRCFDTATIHATCEDYRAGATIDLVHDREPPGGRSPAHCSSSGAPQASALPTTCSGSGARRPMTSAARRSTAVTSSPKSVLQRWPRPSSTFSGDVVV